MKQPEELTFFLDRSLGKHIVADSLRAAGVRVEVHDDHFAPDAADENWILDIGRRGWIVLTKDRHIRNRTLEVRAVAVSGVRLFALTSAGAPATEMAQTLVAALPKIRRVVQGNSAPFVATVTKHGRVTIVLGAKRLKRFR